MVTESSSNAERAAEILIHLGQAGPAGLSLQLLAEKLADPKSATRRALVALSKRGFVEGTGRRGQYRLGPAIYGLANRTGSINEFVERFRPAVIAVAARTGQSSYLLVRAGFDAICVDMHEGTAFVQTLTGGIGGRVPLGIGSGSISILTGLDPTTREAIIKENQHRYGHYNKIDIQHVRSRVERAVKLGYSYDIAETYAEAAGVAVPVRLNTAGVIAAISIAIPAAQLDPERAHSIAHLIRGEIEKHSH
ncbi:transcriptional regulator, IclR family [Rhizobiales bacterium GAS191]|jgi:DNA-binding IclR family transcriptional regulator|nr:transcriptional regulator, IclR family [Rhizobiales bacterium GAS113]SEE22940.1 transcriptional regulator, IclR family [Rhizobiales bacterium GAS188]SEE34234.1 transcriptional regulator, IclR family [Rhizobiales bacterium GAS191]